MGEYILIALIISFILFLLGMLIVTVYGITTNKIFKFFGFIFILVYCIFTLNIFNKLYIKPTQCINNKIETVGNKNKFVCYNILKTDSIYVLADILTEKGVIVSKKNYNYNKPYDKCTINVIWNEDKSNEETYILYNMNIKDVTFTEIYRTHSDMGLTDSSEELYIIKKDNNKEYLKFLKL